MNGLATIHPPSKPDVSHFGSSGSSTVLRGSSVLGLAWALFRFLVGPCHGYLQRAALVGTIARRFRIVAMSMKELTIGLLVGTLPYQRLDVVDLADLVHGLKQASTPRTPPALPFEQDCLAGG